MMNKNDFENALMSTIVDYISDQIILRYVNASKQAAVLITGALIGYQDAVNSLRELKEDGWKFTVVLSEAAGQLLTEEKIRNDIDPEAIYVEGAPVNGRKIINESQFVIIPCLTINTAAKVANCINDNLITNMIYYSMTQGKPIVAAVDGCCPDNKVREQKGFKVTEAYKVRLRRNLEDMITYGIHLTTDINLFEKVNEVFTASFDFPLPSSDDKAEQEEAKAISCGCSVQEKVEGASVRLDKKVIGRIDIAKAICSCAGNVTRVIVRKDALVTQLAKDAANERNIIIVTE